MKKVITFNLRVGAWLPFGSSTDKPSISTLQSGTAPVYFAPLVYYSSVDHVPECLQIPESVRTCLSYQIHGDGSSSAALYACQGGKQIYATNDS
jgi:hypothetical protein